MQLEFPWNPHQSAIITALQKVLKRPVFQIEPETVFAVTQVLQRRDIPFFKAWDDITGDMASRSCRIFQNIAICQAAAGVLASYPRPYVAKLQQYKLFYSIIFSNDCRSPQIPQLPVRIPDKELCHAAAAGDLPKTIMLYDMAATPGQKLKNICHSLLNCRRYQELMTLHEIYGCLEYVDPAALELHTFAPFDDPGKAAFNSYYCRTYGVKDEFFWDKMRRFAAWRHLMRIALDEGVSTESGLFNDKYRYITIKDYLHLLSEISPLCQTKDILSFANDFTYQLGGAEIFTQWEREQQHD